jgi:hypothetical protein
MTNVEVYMVNESLRNMENPSNREDLRNIQQGTRNDQCRSFLVKLTLKCWGYSHGWN